MQAEDRIIHFSTELIHTPSQVRKETLQKLYFDLSQTKAAYDNTDFTNPMQPRFFSKRGKKTQSLCVFLPDRVLLVEEWADIPLSTFLEKVREVGLRVLDARGVGRYNVHACTIRSTFALTHFDDARKFLLDHACSQEGMIAPFLKRPISVGGLRFVMPETNEDPGTLHVTIESYRHSRNEVFVEAKGIFTRNAVGPENIDLVMKSIQEVRHFISDRVYPYLNQFDQVEPPDLPEE
ncbi:MAG: hypothetical protein IT368_13265 [Candidatus Hydrogenedentes bacterium]|nr:hypothetical protein [Candidatus Hydrogenedentota bacterium]